jgi:hypothetical protein
MRNIIADQDYLAMLPRDFVLKAASALNFDLEEQTRQRVYDEWLVTGGSWWIPYHFEWGMAIRNRLRSLVCPDEQIPVTQDFQNWDNFYVPLVELAVGIRDIDTYDVTTNGRKVWT